MAKYKSRATRLSETLDMTEKIADVEQLKEELEEWLDNLPENSLDKKRVWQMF